MCMAGTLPEQRQRSASRKRPIVKAPVSAVTSGSRTLPSVLIASPNPCRGTLWGLGKLSHPLN